MKMKEFYDYFFSKRLLVNIPTFLKKNIFLWETFAIFQQPNLQTNK